MSSDMTLLLDNIRVRISFKKKMLSIKIKIAYLSNLALIYRHEDDLEKSFMSQIQNTPKLIFICKTTL